MRILLVATVCILASCGEMTSRSVCGAQSPTQFYSEGFRRSPRLPPGEAYHRPFIGADPLDEFDRQALECFASEGDPVAIVALAHHHKNQGDEADARSLLNRYLRDRAPSALTEEELSACQDIRRPEFFRCRAGFADAWLLLGDMAFANLDAPGNAQVARAAYSNAAALGFRDAMARVWDIDHRAERNEQAR